MTRPVPTPVRTMGLEELADQSAIYDVLLDHGLRGVRAQILLRLVLAAFLDLTVVLQPPANHRVACYVIALGYTAWAAVTAVLARNGGVRLVQLFWLGLFVDLAALAAVTAVASGSDEVSWTADILMTGFFLVPALASIQLRTRLCAAVVAPTVLVYLGVSAAARIPNGEPWASVLLRTGVLAGLAVAAVLLSSVQRSRVLTIGSLAADRMDLLSQMVSIEERERRELSENLHDGALQYVLAARQDLADARGGDRQALDRIDQALRESAQLLRSTMTELHPAVLDQSGLASALGDLVRSVDGRRGLSVSVDVAAWPVDVRTEADRLLFATARELLTNVIKHADAQRAELTAELEDCLARLTVIDDGVGFDEELATTRLGEGHIGLAARRTRLVAAGGSLRISPRRPRGTVAVAEMPLHVGHPAPVE